MAKGADGTVQGAIDPEGPEYEDEDDDDVDYWLRLKLWWDDYEGDSPED